MTGIKRKAVYKTVYILRLLNNDGTEQDMFVPNHGKVGMTTDKYQARPYKTEKNAERAVTRNLDYLIDGRTFRPFKVEPLRVFSHFVY